ncbi:LysR family transcriptional regulator [Paracoccus sp. 11-3]|uniref:LysR family transcriptional regulator n=1 Tax=Paracoccus amoyensis TaxID=2760093 RepID=A0A926GAV3_9RHOB|nr:LysR substrate-binding domain-containing protein [Paracoccus amoyensis]MBC9247638.1 LysR family transcriptional regulator [Paracoccus amoyensis]
MMDIRQLRYFVAIVEQGSFSRAAKVLHVAQPALSLHVRNMEDSLGAELLFRSARGVVPTDAGAILLRHARAILDQIAVAGEEIRGQQADPEGEVRLGLPGTIGQIMAVPLITAVHARFPRIKLRIAEAMSGFIHDWLRDDRIDLAVLYGKAADGDISTRAVLQEDLHFVASATKPIAAPAHGAIPFAQLAQLPLILPGLGHGLRDLLERTAQAHEVSLNTAIDVDSYGNIKTLVRDGFGCSILPLNAIWAEVSSGSLKTWPISGPSMQRIAYLAQPTQRPLSNAAKAVLTLTQETLVDLVKDGRWIGAQLVSHG